MSDSQREKFEAWFKRHHDVDYCSPNVKSVLFECWQAAIESVVVELPLWFHPREGGQAYRVGEVRQSIEKAGVKCK